MSLLPAIKTGKLRQQLRHLRLLHKILRLLAIVIKHPVAIYKMLPVDVVLGVQGLAFRREGRGLDRGRHLRCRTEIIKAPKADGILRSRAWFFRSLRLDGPFAQPNVIYDSVATDRSFHEPPECQPARLGAACKRVQPPFEHLFAIHPEHHRLFVNARHHIMPFAVANVGLGVIVAAATRRIEGQRSTTCMGIELPMRGRRLLVTGD